ncbi:glycosyltransferase [Geomonas sp. RF6]|uniref:glycosyltransferase n=1 Tax=Geomonas sp. RF6 TaxID=2897342 RepID=UPI001E3CDF14|nr:glycosyltransferase [Geomonas sp. RF6]UFS69932.1 glycosyltransferase [Geomonas sp. RF6]
MKRGGGEGGAVLQIVTGLGVGGAERVVLELATRLQKEGYRPIVVSLGSQDGILSQYPELSVPVHTLVMKKNPWSFLRGCAQIVRLARREGARVLHAHMFHSLVVAVACRLLLPGSRVVFTSHSFSGFSPLRSVLINLTKGVRDADVVFSSRQHVSFNCARTAVIPNGVALPGEGAETVDPREGGRVFLFVGRLERPKNPVALVQAFSRMRHRDCELWMVGDGSLRGEVTRAIAECGVGDRVRLLGVRGDVPSLMQGADCFVMSSLWEGLPMVILEAGAAGIPVVAPPVGAIPEILGDGCGFLAEPGLLEGALDEVLDDYQEARRRGNRLREKVAGKYSLEGMARAHAALYDGVSAAPFAAAR